VKEHLQESRAIARTPRDAAAVLFGLKFADNIHYKFKSIDKLRKPGFRAPNIPAQKQNLTQNGDSRSFKVTCFGVSWYFHISFVNTASCQHPLNLQHGNNSVLLQYISLSPTHEGISGIQFPSLEQTVVIILCPVASFSPDGHDTFKTVPAIVSFVLTTRSTNLGHVTAAAHKRQAQVL